MKEGAKECRKEGGFVREENPVLMHFIEVGTLVNMISLNDETR